MILRSTRKCAPGQKMARNLTGSLRRRSVATTLVALAVAAATAPGAMAQKFTDAADSFQNHVKYICPKLATLRSDPSGTALEQDLFLRCNGALNPTAQTTSKENILDQYFGVQAVAAQSDGLALGNRPNQAVAGRMEAMASSMKGRTAFNSGKPILVASIAQDSSGLLGGVRQSRLDGFFSAGGFMGEQDSTSDELGFDDDGVWVAGGIDYQVNNAFGVGGAIGYIDSSAEFGEVGGQASGGSLDTTGWSISGYGVWNATNKLTVTGLISYGQSEFDNTRLINIVDQNGNPSGGGAQGNAQAVRRRALGNTEADNFQATLGASYDLITGEASLTPAVDVTWYKADIDGFSETGAQGLNLTFGSQEVESVRITAGATAAQTISASWGVFQPYVKAQLVWELKDDAQQVTAFYSAIGRVPADPASTFVISTNPSDDVSWNLGIGAQVQWSNGLRGFAELSGVVGLDNVKHGALSLGLRKAF